MPVSAAVTASAAPCQRRNRLCCRPGEVPALSALHRVPCQLPQALWLKHRWWHQNRLASHSSTAGVTPRERPLRSSSRAATAVTCCPAPRRCPTAGTGCAGHCSPGPNEVASEADSESSTEEMGQSRTCLSPAQVATNSPAAPRLGHEQRPGLPVDASAASAPRCQETPAHGDGSISSGAGLALAVPRLARISHSAAQVQTIKKNHPNPHKEPTSQGSC